MIIDNYSIHVSASLSLSLSFNLFIIYFFYDTYRVSKHRL